MTVTAILLAGGAGARLQQPNNKVYAPVADRSLLRWSLASLLSSPLVDDAVLVIRDVDAALARRAVGDELWPRVRSVVAGGATRHTSEEAGLHAIAGDVDAGHIELVLVHDAARPFVSAALVARTVETARRVGGAVPVLPLEATVVHVENQHLGSGVMTQHVRRAQTPQGFAAAPLLGAYRAAAAAGFGGSDTAESVLAYSSLEVAAVEGEPDNVKVTFADDLAYAQQLAARHPQGP
jgi:2-C-methyl-D-erythritol 4-phosphate cytidylyltransferase